MEDTAKNETPHKRATKVGKVVSDSMNKSVVVEVGRRVEHGRYKRTIRRTSRFMAHDEKNAAKVGDRVRIEETRPMSKRKRWILKEVLVKAEA
jgi:small subunit ribosomal protein S17